MIKCLADLVADIINDSGCGVIGTDLFTGSFDENNHSCSCGNCDLCVNGCLTLVRQGASNFGNCYRDITSNVIVTCRSSVGSDQNFAFDKCVNILNKLVKTNTYDGYKINFNKGTSTINTANDRGGRISFYLTITAFYTKLEK